MTGLGSQPLASFPGIPEVLEVRWLLGLLPGQVGVGSTDFASGVIYVTYEELVPGLGVPDGAFEQVNTDLVPLAAAADTWSLLTVDDRCAYVELLMFCCDPFGYVGAGYEPAAVRLAFMRALSLLVRGFLACGLISLETLSGPCLQVL
jgi:hypothetical protein